MSYIKKGTVVLNANNNKGVVSSDAQGMVMVYFGNHQNYEFPANLQILAEPCHKVNTSADVLAIYQTL